MGRCRSTATGRTASYGGHNAIVARLLLRPPSPGRPRKTSRVRPTAGRAGLRDGLSEVPSRQRPAARARRDRHSCRCRRRSCEALSRFLRCSHIPSQGARCRTGERRRCWRPAMLAAGVVSTEAQQVGRFYAGVNLGAHHESADRVSGTTSAVGLTAGIRLKRAIRPGDRFEPPARPSSRAMYRHQRLVCRSRCRHVKRSSGSPWSPGSSTRGESCPRFRPSLRTTCGLRPVEPAAVPGRDESHARASGPS